MKTRPVKTWLATSDSISLHQIDWYGPTASIGRWITISLVVFCLFAGVASVQADEGDVSADELFQQRIMPIFRSTKPSSCIECHLSSVDLKDYILPSHEATFVALRDADMIDLERPEQSRILELIRMGMNDEYKQNADGPRISNELREQELAAFTAWIKASCDDQSLRDIATPETVDEIGPQRPEAVIRHNRLDRITDSFERNIWSLRFRCANCHMSDGHNFERLSEEFGEKMEWLKKDGPRATVEYLIDSDLIDVDEPESSMLLLKPLNEVKHGGGIKMARRDTDYMTFLSWIEDYSNSYLDMYDSVESLPDTARRRGSEIWLRVQGLPDGANGMTGLLSVHAARDNGSYSEEPTAVASVNVRKNPRFGTFAQGFLLIETPYGGARSRIRAGQYQVRLYFDENRDTQEHDFDVAFASATEIYRAQVRSDWQSGFKGTTVVSIPESQQVELPQQVTIGAEIDLTRQKCTALLNATTVAKLDTNAYVPDVAGLLSNPFEQDTGEFEKWRGPYLQRAPVDAWGHELELRVNQRATRPVERERFGDSITVLVALSPGPDGIFHTGDDVREIKQLAGAD